MSEKEIALILIEELEINLEIVGDYISYAKANSLITVDTKTQKFIRTKQDNWEKYKMDILLLNKELYCERVKSIYKGFFMLDNTDGIIVVEEPKRIVSEINDLLSELREKLVE